MFIQKITLLNFDIHHKRCFVYLHVILKLMELSFQMAGLHFKNCKKKMFKRTEHSQINSFQKFWLQFLDNN